MTNPQLAPPNPQLTTHHARDHSDSSRRRNPLGRPAGDALFCRVSDPTVAAQWTAWAILATGACPGGDVALAAV